MSFQANYPGAIVVEAANYGYPGDPRNEPRAWFLHTPEEPADSTPSTPYYFHNAPAGVGSTTYFVSYLGFVFQCVPETKGAHGNGVEGKPYPTWADPHVNLNLQTLSVEIEGYAATIYRTMPRDSPQWKALVDLMAHRCMALGLNPDWTGRHSDVSIYRSDPGTLNVAQVVADVKAKMQEDGMGMTPEERQEFDDFKVAIRKNVVDLREATQRDINSLRETTDALRQNIVDLREAVQRDIRALREAIPGDAVDALKRGDQVTLT